MDTPTFGTFASACSASSASANRKLIVVVEDDVNNAELFQEVFSDEPNYQITVVTDAEQGYNVIRAARPSLVLMDILLPGASGLQLADILLEDPVTQDIPVLFVSAIPKSKYSELRPRGELK